MPNKPIHVIYYKWTMEQISTRAIWGLISVAIIGGISLAAKETISNIWVGLSFMLNPTMRRGKTIEAKIQGEFTKGHFKKLWPVQSGN